MTTVTVKVISVNGRPPKRQVVKVDLSSARRDGKTIDADRR